MKWDINRKSQSLTKRLEFYNKQFHVVPCVLKIERFGTQGDKPIRSFDGLLMISIPVECDSPEPQVQ